MDDRVVGMDALKLAVIAAAAVLVFAAYTVLSKPPVERYCYKDACIVGEADSVAGIRALISGSQHVILVTEGDNETSQANSLLFTATKELSEDFGATANITFIAFGLEDGQRVRCLYTELTGPGNKTARPANASAAGAQGWDASVGFCENVTPAEGELMLVLRYPGYGANEISLSGRTVEFRAKTAADALALVTEVFEKVFF
jgi:hypothetical protein